MKSATTLVLIAVVTIAILFVNSNQTWNVFWQRACEFTHWSGSCDSGNSANASASTSTSTSTSTSLK